MSERQSLPCSIPFCSRVVYRYPEDFGVCPSHLMHVSEATWARYEAREWNIAVQSALIIECILGGIMHLAKPGDEGRARMRASSRRKREIAQ